MKTIYLLNNCDEWKSHSSMGLIMASTSLRKIKAEIIAQIKQGSIEYNRGNEDMPKTAQIKMLREDCEEHSVEFMFDNLVYGFVNVVLDGERQ